MKKTHKLEKNFEFEIVALAVIVRREFSWDVAPLRIKTNWYSLKELNADRLKTKNKKLYRFLKANSTEKQREELMKRVRVVFD